MYGKVKNIWDIKTNGGSSDILTSNNTFTGKNTFENTGDVVAIKRTDNQSFGIVFKKEDDERVGYIGTSENDANKTTVWGATGLKLQTTNSPIEITSGTAVLTYTSSNTSKNRREVLVRDDFRYIKKSTGTNINIPANSYETYEFTNISGLIRGLNEFYIVLTTSSVDIGFDVKIQCNNLNYPNMSDVKTITITDLRTQNLDQAGLVQVGIIQYGNNKLRLRFKNLHSSPITFNGARVYLRVPASIGDN